MATLYGLADVARGQQVSVQVAQNWWARGKMPDPDHMTAGGRPLWTRASLAAADLEPGKVVAK